MWMLFVGELRRRRLEYALGSLAVALVVAALITQRAVSASAEDRVHALAHRLGRNMLVVPAGADLEAFYDQRYGPEGLPDAVPGVIRASPLAQHVQFIEPRLYGNVRAAAGEVVVVGQDGAWPSLRDGSPAVLGARAAQALGVRAGGSFQLGDQAFTVLQVADAPPDGLDRGVFVPLAAAQRALHRPGQLSALRLGGCWCRIDVATLAAEMEKLLPGTRAITVAGMLKAQKGSVGTMQRYSWMLQLAGGLVIALVVAALAASQARRRFRELGLLVAIGARPGALAAVFTLQAAAWGGLGGALGWLAAALFTDRVAGALLGAPVTTPPALLVPAVALAALVSGVAASVPNARASALDPTVVLRES